MIRVGVVGGTGYTGVELLRLLLRHPGVTVSLITSRGEAGRRLDDLFPSLLGACDLAFTDPAEADYSACDLVFFAIFAGFDRFRFLCALPFSEKSGVKERFIGTNCVNDIV